MAKQNSSSYKAYKTLQHWKPTDKILPSDKLFNKKDKLYPLMEYIYKRTEEFYLRLPKRKNGQESFIHPINVVLALKEAGIKDQITLAAGLLHDAVEERVDLYRDDENIIEDKKGIKILDDYEIKVFNKIEKELNEFCIKNKFDTEIINELISIVKLLTRHKRDFYYKSIFYMFQDQDEKIQEKAILVKLADRMHNILSIECFNEQERIYQCFKNLFILNNVKKYILENKGKESFLIEPLPPIGKLFKRCAKATYDAYLRILELCNAKGTIGIRSMIQLAFKKFALEKEGAKGVTSVNKKEAHPIRLYGGIIRKYDFRLHHQWRRFDAVDKNEKRYCEMFFSEFNFSDEQIQAIIDYKDAYALKEVVTFLIYIPDYIISRFEYSDLFRKNK